jgi:tripartite-type tricarboxylate transporter receptor subunit TctC
VELIMKAIAAQENLDMSFVPFQGDAPVSVAILGGHVTAGAFSAGAWGAHVRAGSMRLLASMEEERIDYAPDVPTLIELGYPFSGSTLVYAYGRAVFRVGCQAADRGVRRGGPLARVY